MVWHKGHLGSRQGLSSQKLYWKKKKEKPLAYIAFWAHNNKKTLGEKAQADHALRPFEQNKQ